MWDNKDNCKNCKNCCRFEKKETYLAPIFSIEEINRIKSDYPGADFVKLQNNSKSVFQIRLEKSKKSDSVFVCPFLDEGTSLCKIYSIRPLDCKIWPLVVLKSKDNKKSLLATFGKESCCFTEEMSQKEFEEYEKKLVSWFEKEKFEQSLSKFPDLVWENVFELRTIRELILEPGPQILQEESIIPARITLSKSLKQF